MWTNYLKIALRRLVRNRLYTLTNLVGLSIGFASVLIIFLFVQKEQSFDNFHQDKDRIYRLVRTTNTEIGDVRSVRTAAAISTFIASDFPQVESVTRYARGGGGYYADSLTVTNEPVRLSFLRIDTDFFKVFTFDLALGEYPDYEINPKSTVITESKAIAIFGSVEAAIGDKIRIGKNGYTIVGVLKDIPLNSSIQFSVATSLVNANSQFPHALTQWNGNSANIALKFSNSFSETQKIDLLNTIADEHSERIPNAPNTSYSLQAVSEIHFDLQLADGVPNKIDPTYLTIFSLVALIILISSVTNYCSLTLSQSVERVKEIGVRRTIGAKRFQLLLIYFVESILLTSLAFVIGLILVEILVPQLELLLGRDLGIQLFSAPEVLIVAYIVAVVIAMFSVAYPALLVSKKQLTDLRGSSRSMSLFNKSFFIDLVNGFQVAVFLFLIAATVFVNRQFDFIQNENLGFSKDQVVIVNVSARESIFKKDALKNEFAISPYVSSLSFAVGYPSLSGSPLFSNDLDLSYNEYQVESGYVQALGLELVEGRLLEDLEAHRKYTLVNETAAAKLGRAKALGQQLNGREIIGIVKDFHFESKQEPIRPLALRLFTADGFGNLIVKLKGSNTQAAMDDLLNRFDEVTGSTKFAYTFLDERYDKIYSSEMIILRIMSVFTTVALLIAVLGVLGSSAYTVKRKIKEISIRKILGANMIEVTKSSSTRGFTRMGLGALVALPLSYIWITEWLSGFSYHIDVSLFSFLPILAIAALIILPAMVIHAMLAFFANTVNHLKDE